ncbi:S-layer protein domain-containing protein [Methanococcoides sp. FTZ1]|uniref:S-layer protein domain-containing protein n=1 Tax=Methanococcoides sp. FTZ1 TaxID=3439061 RepID=UPI003F8605B6
MKWGIIILNTSIHAKHILIALILISFICTVASAQGSTGDRIWDADENMSLEYTWTAASYSGFYYDLDSGISSENLTIKLDSRTDRSIGDGDLIYSTKPIETDFENNDWGSYQVIGFMAERYFAGYTDNSSFVKDDVSLISEGKLAKVLTDSDDKISFYTGSSLVLEEGYKLDIAEIDMDGNKVLVSLTKDGEQVDTGVLTSRDDYVYEKDLGSAEDIPVIAVHFAEIFRGMETNAVFVQGIFQISDQYVEIDDGDDFGRMEIKSVSANEIKMENDDSISLSRGNIVNIMGKLKFVVADDDTLRFAPFVDLTAPGTYELRGTITEDEDMVWTPLNFEGFYYNIDEGIGTESLEVVSLDGRTIQDGDLVYSTVAEEVNFEYRQWGKFLVVGFMADKYFAGYPDNRFTDDVSMLSEGQLSKVLIDNDKKSTVVPGSSLVLEEGYEIEVTEVDISGDKVLVSVLKDGKKVDSGIVTSNDDLVVEKDIGSAEDVPLIVVHFAEIFRGTETNAVFVEGMFQISENFVKVDGGDSYGKMEVKRISSERIEMENEDSITLSRDKTIPIMGGISFKVADSSDVRYYPFVTYTTPSSKALSIEMPSVVVQGDTVDIKVIFRGAAVSEALVEFDGDEIGLTSDEGIISYRPMEVGTFSISAEKEGFASAHKDVEIISPDDVTKKTVIEISPETVYEGDTITISTLKAIGGDPVAGVEILYDGVSVGVTSDDGKFSYKVRDPGVHKIISQPDEYLGAEFNLEVIDLEPVFEYSNLVIAPAEVGAGDPVNITVDVMNSGDDVGSVNVQLNINDEVVESRTIILDVDEERSVEFTRTESEAGEYLVRIGSESGSYVVTSGIPSLGLFVSVMILVSAAFVAMRQRKEN